LKESNKNRTNNKGNTMTTSKEKERQPKTNEKGAFFVWMEIGKKNLIKKGRTNEHGEREKAKSPQRCCTTKPKRFGCGLQLFRSAKQKKGIKHSIIFRFWFHDWILLICVGLLHRWGGVGWEESVENL
jgi:hypothetical protein